MHENFIQFVVSIESKESKIAWVVFEKNQTVLKTVQKPIIGVFPGAIKLWRDQLHGRFPHNPLFRITQNLIFGLIVLIKQKN